MPPPRRVVLVTGLSGAGRSSILHMLEDLGYEAVDNPPMRLIEELVTRGDRPAAVGIDTRSRGFEAGFVLTLLSRLRLNPALRPELVFASATEDVLLRRYTETRRRHPMAPNGRVIEGITSEIALMTPLKEAADLVVDTTGLALAALRAMVEERFGVGGAQAGMTVSLTSFAYPKGLPRDADLVFDMRFLRNPHYDPILRQKTGLDDDVAAYVAADPDFEPTLSKITDLLRLLLPRFVQEGKKYVNIAIGCTGGRHRSVFTVQRLAAWLDGDGTAGGADSGPDCVSQDVPGGAPAWRVVVNHRELRRAGMNGDPPGRANVDEGGPGEGTGRPIDALAAGPSGPSDGRLEGGGPGGAVHGGGEARPATGRGALVNAELVDGALVNRAKSAGLTMPAQAQEA